MKKIAIIIIVAVVVVSAAGIYISRFLAEKSNELANVILVKKGTVIELVSVTGNVNPKDNVSLAFEKGGRIVRVNFKEGDKVNVGSRLVELDASELLAQLREAKANLDAEKARLEDLKSGTRPEEIAVKRVELQKAQQDLLNDYSGVPDVLNDAYIKADDAVNAKTDQLFTDDNTQTPKLTFAVTDYQIDNDARALRLASTNELTGWRDELKSLDVNSPPLVLETALAKAKSHLSVISDFLKKVLDAVDKSYGLSVATMQTYRDNNNLGRTSVNTALTAIGTEGQTIAAQKIVVDRVQQELNLKLAGATKEQITAKEAQVKQAEANVQLIEAQIQKTVLKSPLNGIVTKQNAKVGEIIAANAPVAAVISEGNFEIEANVPEVDIAKVKMGDTAKITLDAYGSEVLFEARVVSVDPAETVIEGVSTYKVTLEFTKEDERLKSGMTANTDIVTGVHENVLVIPQRAVIGKNSEKFVNIVVGNKAEEREVTVGLRGSDGNIEITSGLNEGDKITLSGGK